MTTNTGVIIRHKNDVPYDLITQNTIELFSLITKRCGCFLHKSAEVLTSKANVTPSYLPADNQVVGAGPGAVRYVDVSRRAVLYGIHPASAGYRNRQVSAHRRFQAPGLGRWVSVQRRLQAPMLGR